MRLIDADALIRHFTSKPIDCYYTSYIVNVIAASPTVTPVPLPEPPETVSAEPERCSCWHAIPTGMKREEGTFEYRCWGTPERDICTCGGDKSKCDFYGG